MTTSLEEWKNSLQKKKSKAILTVNMFRSSVFQWLKMQVVEIGKSVTGFSKYFQNDETQHLQNLSALFEYRLHFPSTHDWSYQYAIGNMGDTNPLRSFKNKIEWQ